MGYRPDPMLTALSNYRRLKGDAPVISRLAWIQSPAAEAGTADESDAYWRGAGRAATSAGYRLEKFRSDESTPPKAMDRVFQERGIQGLLLPPDLEIPDWEGFPWEKYAVVRLGRQAGEFGLHLVTLDEAANTRSAFRRLSELGYRRIGFVTGEARSESADPSGEAGFWMTQRSVPEECRLPVFSAGGLAEGDARREFERWLEACRPDAVLADPAALGGLLAEPRGVLPEGIGLAATRISGSWDGAGIDPNAEEIGRVGFLMLRALLDDGDRGTPEIFRQVLVSGRWRDGATLPERRDA
jgi:DNA-binding LacI/PurR family transcriptional regulator